MGINTYVRLERIEKKLDAILTLLQKEEKEMSKLDDQIVALTAQVGAVKNVEDSAVTLINAIPGLVQSAVDKAIQAGATQQQLQALTDLQDALRTNAAPLADAITANTPPPAPVPPQPQPQPPVPQP